MRGGRCGGHLPAVVCQATDDDDEFTLSLVHLSFKGLYVIGVIFIVSLIPSVPRLIVVAEKSTVYKSFPIPLINRLEKHFLVMSTSLTEKQSELSRIIGKWANEFTILEFGR